ncbi:hypothetical protein L1887_63177 [Cichorium endivia]|nr:hypothetical protein L1887_63177 [Cichorium endivia]
MLTLEPFSEDQGRSAVHPARGDPANQLPCALRVYSPVDSHTCQTPWSVFKTGRMGCPQAVPGARRYIAETARAANHDRRDGISTSLSTARALAAASNPHRSTRPESIGGPAIAPWTEFTALLGCIPKQPDSQTAPRGATGSGHDGALTSLAPPSRGLGPGPPLRTLLQTTIRDSEAVRFSSWADPASSQDDTLGSSSRASLTAHDTRHNTRVFSTTTSRASTEGDSSLGQPHHKHGRTNLRPDAMCPDKGCMVGGDAMRDAQRRRALGRMALGATCVQKTRWFTGFCNSHQVHVHGSFCFAGFDNDPSAGSPTETLLRLLLPLNDKVQWNSRDVAGGEPPTSPRS